MSDLQSRGEGRVGELKVPQMLEELVVGKVQSLLLMELIE